MISRTEHAEAGGEVRDAVGTGPHGPVRASFPDGRYHVLTSSPQNSEATVRARTPVRGAGPARCCRDRGTRADRMDRMPSSHVPSAHQQSTTVPPGLEDIRPTAC